MKVLYFSSNKIYMNAFTKEAKCAIYVCYISKQCGSKAHNLLHVNSPPQTQGGCENNLKLSTKVRRRSLGCDLVKVFAS